MVGSRANPARLPALSLAAILVAACGSSAGSASPIPAASSGAPASATPDSGSGMRVSFVGLTDGGTAAATRDAKGRPLVTVKIEVAGAAPWIVTLTANGLLAVDAGGRGLEAQNTAGVVLKMDFNHELSHMFGMMDDWPYRQGVAGPDGSPIDDWIPYVMFGWTDTDGDGVREILDPTPYGTSGPQP